MKSSNSKLLKSKMTAIPFFLETESGSKCMGRMGVSWAENAEIITIMIKAKTTNSYCKGNTKIMLHCLIYVPWQHPLAHDVVLSTSAWQPVTCDFHVASCKTRTKQNTWEQKLVIYTKRSTVYGVSQVFV